MGWFLPALLLFLQVDYTTHIQHWREQRERELKSDDGWLTVAGLFWLREGRNEIALPPDTAPPQVVELRGGKVTVGGRELRPNTSDVLTVGRVRLFAIRRGGRYAIRLRDPESAMRREFTGLRFFPAKPGLRIVARFVPDARKIPIPNVVGQTEEMESPGYVAFRLGGREVRLRPVLEADGAKQLFFIFRDLTSGKETYGAGRFLDTDLPRDGNVVLDFNKAYNPPCAFTPYATCPLPPRENRLNVRIEAGELAYGEH